MRYTNITLIKQRQNSAETKKMKNKKLVTVNHYQNKSQYKRYIIIKK